MPPAAASADALPMLEVLDLALGTPDDGCVNLHLLHTAIKHLVVFIGAESTLVNIKSKTSVRLL